MRMEIIIRIILTTIPLKITFLNKPSMPKIRVRERNKILRSKIILIIINKITRFKDSLKTIIKETTGTPSPRQEEVLITQILIGELTVTRAFIRLVLKLMHTMESIRIEEVNLNAIAFE
jgi:hypothetical protein